MTYTEKLKDPRWQKKRLEILERDKFTCQLCGDKRSLLVVHHLIYNNEPWDCPNNQLITICEDCHKKLHDKPHIPTIREIIEMSEYEFKDEVIERIIQQETRDVLNSLKVGRDFR